MSYTIFTAPAFNKIYTNLDEREQQWIEAVRRNLKEAITGKILHFTWFREKRNNGKRLYYLVDEEQKKILLVAFSTKKDQQETINRILLNMRELFQYLRSL